MLCLFNKIIGYTNSLQEPFLSNNTFDVVRVILDTLKKSFL
jgi:hypothetical protein